MMFRSNKYKLIFLSIVFLFMSCSSIPTKKNNKDMCQIMKEANQEELNTICQRLLDDGTKSVDTLLNCLNNNSDLKTPIIKIKVKNYWQKQLYLGPKTVADLSLTLLAIILQKSEFTKLENTSAFPIEDSEREKIIAEFLDWFNNDYKKEQLSD